MALVHRLSDASPQARVITCHEGAWSVGGAAATLAALPGISPGTTLVLGSALRTRPRSNTLGEYLGQLDLLRQAQAILHSPELQPARVRAMCGKAASMGTFGSIRDCIVGAHGNVVALGLDERELHELHDLSVPGSKEAGGAHSPFPIALGDLRRATLARKLPVPVSAALYDVDEEQLVYAHEAHANHPPASLTKLVTLSLVQQRLKKTGSALDLPVHVSEAAASVNSWWGIPAGSSVPVGNLMRAAAVVSCNEAANALAEWHSGSQERFTDAMNNEVARIGLGATRLSSPSGLGKLQTTNALDMIRLGRHIVTKHPALIPMCQERAFTFGDKTAPATNRLLEQVEGVTGLKTGTLNGVCCHLLFSFRRNERHYIAVVLGAPTKRARDYVIRAMINMTRKPPPALQVPRS